MKTTELIYSMLTENTGSHMLDSGGAYGRHWQRNAKKTLDDFMNEPECTLNIDSNYFDVTVSVFHYLNNSLEQSELCKEFNKLDCESWNGCYYGISYEQQCWLEDNGFKALKYGAEFNTYNYDSNLSQVLQGTRLERDGDCYVLLQVHNGCDVRGGYTDAKLFKVNEDYFLLEDCTFGLNDDFSLDIHGDDYSLYCHSTGDTRYCNYDDLSDIRDITGNKTEFTGSLMAY